MTVTTERRQACRFESNSPCQLSFKQNQEIVKGTGALLDLSTCGCRIRCDFAVAKGTAIDILLAGRRAIAGEVVRTKPSAGKTIVGVRFSEGEIDSELVSLLASPRAFDCLKRLGLSWPCSATDVRLAFRKRAMQVHPDFGGSEAEFQSVRDAFDAAMRVVAAAD